MCLTGDGVNTDVIGLGAFPLPAERYVNALRLTEHKRRLPQYLYAAVASKLNRSASC